MCKCMYLFYVLANDNECLEPTVCSEQSPGCEDVIGSFFCHPIIINATVAPMGILNDTWISILVEFEPDTTLLVSSGDNVLVDGLYYLYPEYLQMNASVDTFKIQNVSFALLQSNQLTIYATTSPGV